MKKIVIYLNENNILEKELLDSIDSNLKIGMSRSSMIKNILYDKFCSGDKSNFNINPNKNISDNVFKQDFKEKEIGNNVDDFISSLINSI